MLLMARHRFLCNFCSHGSVQTRSVPFQKPIRYRTFHFNSGAEQSWRLQCEQKSYLTYKVKRSVSLCAIQSEHSLRLYRAGLDSAHTIPVVKRSVAECVPDRAAFTLGTLLSSSFCSGTELLPSTVGSGNR